MNKNERNNLKYTLYIIIPLCLFLAFLGFLIRTMVLKTRWTNMSLTLSYSISNTSSANRTAAYTNGGDKVYLLDKNARDIYSIIMTAGMNGKTLKPASEDNIHIVFEDDTTLDLYKTGENGVFMVYTGAEKTYKYGLGGYAKYSDFVRKCKAENNLLKPKDIGN